MTPAQWQKVRPILESALELKPESRQLTWIVRALETTAYVARFFLPARGAKSKAITFSKSQPSSWSGMLWPRSRCRRERSWGEYELESVLGAGEWGKLYRARDPRLKRDVAIKILPSLVSADPDRCTGSRKKRRRQRP
jgi:hypothetical protein